MKIWIPTLAFMLLELILPSCTRKPIYTCGLDFLINKPSIESKILTLNTIGIGDTITAFISGTVFGKDSINNKVTIDTLSFASVSFISHKRQDTLKTISNEYGKFEKHLQVGTYDIIVKYAGYVALIVTNISLKQGELKKFDVLLEQQGKTIVETKIDVDKPNYSTYFDKNLNKQVYTFVDNMPKYKEGLSDILSFFAKNFVYPKEQKDNYQGSIYISYIVDTDGQLKNVDVYKKFFEDNYSPVDLEAIRVFKLMQPWTPGQLNGSTVPVKMKLPIKF